MDYRELLKKFLCYLVEEEGTDFLSSFPTNPELHHPISKEEIEELQRLSHEAVPYVGGKHA